jgi:primosomal protein N' (replication factor Y)
LILKNEQLEDVRIKPKYENYIVLTDKKGAIRHLDGLSQRGARAQSAVLEYLIARDISLSWSELKNSVNSQWSTVKALEEKGLIAINAVAVKRDPLAHLEIKPGIVPALTFSQSEALRIVQQGLCPDSGDMPKVFLLKGVTGSGKTEIYLRSLEAVIAQGRRGICLVPEIALTPQTIERFASRFPGRVAVLHSGLSLGQRFDEWNRIKNGECDVVIGPRSALFAPQPDLGLIIIDEEHEWTYKQTDKSPRYHTREAAIKLARLCKSTVILGSATPDVESYYRAQQKEFTLVELEERITPRGIAPLPDIEVVNLADELKAKNYSLFSRSLKAAMTDTLSRHEQIILFLNHRGMAAFLQCRDCGFVPVCRRCMAALTYHSDTRKLVCHHCHYSTDLPVICPACGSRRIRYAGIGTQKVEQETRRYFPSARVLRLDIDAVTRQGDYQEILTRFKNHNADVLIGTQMVAKGLDMPLVTLAGVITADIGLNLPDFRAGERTFQLSCQIAGRAGRGFTAGRVILQTYCPEHYAIKAASHHDYRGFYLKELEYRRQFNYPPFSHLARLLYMHTNEDVCKRETERMRLLLNEEKDRQGLPFLRIMGPVPSFISRVRGRYQWQIVLCGHELSPFLDGITFPGGWILDIDPISVL